MAVDTHAPADSLDLLDVGVREKRREVAETQYAVGQTLLYASTVVQTRRTGNGRLAPIGLHDLANSFTNGRVDVRSRFKELRLAEAILQPCLDALIQDLIGHAVCRAGTRVAHGIPPKFVDIQHVASPRSSRAPIDRGSRVTCSRTRSTSVVPLLSTKLGLDSRRLVTRH